MRKIQLQIVSNVVCRSREAEGAASGVDNSAAHVHGRQIIRDRSSHVVEGVTPIQKIALIELVVDACIHCGAELRLVGIKDKIAAGRTGSAGVWRRIEAT